MTETEQAIMAKVNTALSSEGKIAINKSVTSSDSDYYSVHISYVGGSYQFYVSKDTTLTAIRETVQKWHGVI